MNVAINVRSRFVLGSNIVLAGLAVFVYAVSKNRKAAIFAAMAVIA